MATNRNVVPNSDGGWDVTGAGERRSVHTETQAEAIARAKEIVHGVLVVAAREPSPLLEVGEGAFDDVAASVVDRVEGRWPAADRTTALAGC